MSDDDLKAPLDEGKTQSQALFRGALSVVPVLGGIAAELFTYCSDSLDRRQEAWMVKVTEAINHLKNAKGLSIDDLMHNEKFFSVFLQATIIARRNHQKAKIEALRNALISVGQRLSVDEDLAFQFLRYIDELTVSHLSILRAIAEMADFAEVRSMTEAFSLLGESGDGGLSALIVRTYLRDLDAKGLVSALDLEDLPEFESKAVYIALEQSERHPLQVTELGMQFLAFIECEVGATD